MKVNINAINYDEQIKRVIELLKTEFNCSDFEAEHFYYNNSLRFIKDIATNESIQKRTVRKRDFINIINSKKTLFNEWFILYKGRKAFLKDIKKQYFESDLNTSPFERFFLIDVPDIYKRNQIKQIILLLSKNWGNTDLGLKRNKNLFCPYVFLNNITESDLIEIKKELILEGYNLTDGYDFLGADFSPYSLIASPDKSNEIKVKIVNEMSHINKCL